jgi:hypothetical protein
MIIRIDSAEVMEKIKRMTEGCTTEAQLMTALRYIRQAHRDGAIGHDDAFRLVSKAQSRRQEIQLAEIEEMIK